MSEEVRESNNYDWLFRDLVFQSLEYDNQLDYLIEVGIYGKTDNWERLKEREIGWRSSKLINDLRSNPIELEEFESMTLFQREKILFEKKDFLEIEEKLLKEFLPMEKEYRERKEFEKNVDKEESKWFEPSKTQWNLVIFKKPIWEALDYYIKLKRQRELKKHEESTFFTICNFAWPKRSKYKRRSFNVESYHKYLNSDMWKSRRERALKRDNNTCQECGEPAECVHHKTYERVFIEPLYDLISLCNSCHEFVHTKSDFEKRN